MQDLVDLIQNMRRHSLRLIMPAAFQTPAQKPGALAAPSQSTAAKLIE